MEKFKKILLLSFLFHTIWLFSMLVVRTTEMTSLINQIGGLLFVIYWLISVAIVSLLSFLLIKLLK